MKIAEFLSPQAVVSDLAATSKPEVLLELCGSLARSKPRLRATASSRCCRSARSSAPPASARGWRFPARQAERALAADASFGVSREGVDVRRDRRQEDPPVLRLVAPENSAGVHLKAWRAISRCSRTRAFARRFWPPGRARDLRLDRSRRREGLALGSRDSAGERSLLARGGVPRFRARRGRRAGGARVASGQHRRRAHPHPGRHAGRARRRGLVLLAGRGHLGRGGLPAALLRVDAKDRRLDRCGRVRRLRGEWRPRCTSP